MDKIQKFLVTAGRKDLAQEYYEKIAGENVFVDAVIKSNDKNILNDLAKANGYESWDEVLNQDFLIKDLKVEQFDYVATGARQMEIPRSRLEYTDPKNIQTKRVLYFGPKGTEPWYKIHNQVVYSDANKKYSITVDEKWNKMLETGDFFDAEDEKEYKEYWMKKDPTIFAK